MTRRKNQKKKHVLRDMAQMEAMVSPLRHQVMRTVGAYGVVSIKEIATQLGRSAESLYYHFRALEKVGLLISAGTREVKGRPEALYSTVAEQIFTDPKSHAPEYLDSLKRGASALLRLTDRQLASELDAMGDTRKPRSVSFRIQQLNARLTPADEAQLAKKLDEVTRFLREHDSEEGRLVSVTLASSPIGNSHSAQP